MLKDTAFYDAESVRYSAKRYPAVVSTYVQSFYKSRLSVVHHYIHKYTNSGRLIEIGCADGVVIKSIYDAFPEKFTEYTGVDISEGMIGAAKASKRDRDIAFVQRDESALSGLYDVVLEVGVLNYMDPEPEFSKVRGLLKSDGVYICAIAGTDSLWHRLKPHEEKGFRSFKSYAAYEAELGKHFIFVSSSAAGLFIPHIWKVPALARVVQPIFEMLLRKISPNLFHEKVYVLKPRI